MKKMTRAHSACIWLAFMIVLAPALTARATNETGLESTVWAVSDSEGGSYVFEFRRGGKLLSTSSNGTSGVGTWRQAGSAIRIEVNKGFVEYSGMVESRRMEGQARNRRGHEWRWAAVRQEATPVSSSAVFPRYPPIAMAARADGVVTVEVQVDSAGSVRAAEAVGGHPLLRQAGAEAATRWKFMPEERAEAIRNVRLLFAFRLLPQDCRRRKRKPDPTPAMLSVYQAEVSRRTGCIEYSADAAR